MNELQIISELTGVSIAEIKGKRRTAKLVEARQMTMYLLRKNGHTFQSCAKELNRNHATVIYGCKRIYELISVHEKHTCELINKVNQFIITDFQI